jgi:hypothetical protein
MSRNRALRRRCNPLVSRRDAGRVRSSRDSTHPCAPFDPGFTARGRPPRAPTRILPPPPPHAGELPSLCASLLGASSNSYLTLERLSFSCRTRPIRPQLPSARRLPRTPPNPVSSSASPWSPYFPAVSSSFSCSGVIRVECSRVVPDLDTVRPPASRRGAHHAPRSSRAETPWPRSVRTVRALRCNGPSRPSVLYAFGLGSEWSPIEQWGFSIIFRNSFE